MSEELLSPVFSVSVDGISGFAGTFGSVGSPITGTSSGSASLGFVPTVTSSAVATYVDDENHSRLISLSPSYTSLYVSILPDVHPHTY